MLAGLVLGAIAVFVIEREFLKAAIYSAAGAVLALFGFINAGSLTCTSNGCDFSKTFDVFVAYLLATGIFLLFVYFKPPPRTPEELAAIEEMEKGALTA